MPMPTLVLHGSRAAATMQVMVGLMLFSFLFSPVDHIISFSMNVLSRRFEFQADAFARGLGYGDNLRNGLVANCTENKGDLNPDSWYSTYHHSHPTLVERLKALRSDGTPGAGEGGPDDTKKLN